MKTMQESIQLTIDKTKETYLLSDSEVARIETALSNYQDILVDTLINNGYVYIAPEFKLEVVSTKPRRYILRGQEYTSHRLYKVKATIGDVIYKKISNVYDQFRGE